MRTWRFGLAALVGAGLLAGSSYAEPAKPAEPSPPFTLKEIGPGVYAAIDGPQGKSGSNAGFVIGDDGVVVIDSFFNPDATRALVTEIRKRTPLPIRYVVNTHYHVDHTGGDAVLREAGAAIVAHRNVRGWLRTENLHLFGDRITPAITAQIQGLALPDLVTDTGLTLWLGNRRVDVRAYPGHTGGDLVVTVPDAHVRFCGDLLWRRFAPNIVDGTIPLWIATDTGFAAAPDAAVTRFVPGHGDVADVHDVADFVSYLTTLRTETAAGVSHGLTGPALVAAVLPKLKAGFDGWSGVERVGPREIGFMEAELAGTKHVPVPVKD
jgi:glyoxylase-like metal-dependent hydrolase (beta-lactamase superfamily II)